MVDRLRHGFLLLVVLSLFVIASSWLLTHTTSQSRRWTKSSFHTAALAAKVKRARWKPRTVNASAQRGKLDARCMPKPDVERKQLLSLISHVAPCGIEDALCTAVRRVLTGSNRSLVLTVARWPEQAPALESWTAAVAALRVPAVALLAGDTDATESYAALEAGGVAIAPLPRGAHPTSTVLSRKWVAITRILSLRVGVLYVDVDGLLAHPPFELLAYDSDIEVMSEGWDEEAARGFIHGSDDPSMGWGRYATRHVSIRTRAPASYNTSHTTPCPCPPSRDMPICFTHSLRTDRLCRASQLR